MPAAMQRGADPWLRGLLCHLLCRPAGCFHAALKLILYKLMVCLVSSQGSSSYFSRAVDVVKSSVRTLLKSGVRAAAGF